jgi:hypothetical protein
MNSLKDGLRRAYMKHKLNREKQKENERKLLLSQIRTNNSSSQEKRTIQYFRSLSLSLSLS